MATDNDVGVSVNSSYLRVNPGDEVQLVITVHNDGNSIDVFRLEIEGLDDNWGRPEVLAQLLRPHSGRPDEPHRDCVFESVLTVKPPRDPSATAGSSHLNIKGTRDHNPLLETIVPVELDITPFYAFDLDLRPQRITGSRGTYGINITNTGNDDVNLDLEGRDPEELCQFTFDQPSPRVQPGQDLRVGLNVVPGQRPLKGRPRPYNFTVTATPREQNVEPKEVAGTLNATSRLGESWHGIMSFLRKPIRTPGIPSIPVPMWVWFLCAAVLIAVVVTGATFYTATRSDGAQVAEFRINPGEETPYVISIPDSDAVRITGSLQREQITGDLELRLLRPDGTPSLTFTLPPSATSVAFTVEEDMSNQSREGWIVALQNGSAGGQANGTLRVSAAPAE